MSLAYKVLKAKNKDSQKSPIVYLQGGPGGPTLIMENFWKNHPLRNDRDIILMDQRGTGLSEAVCVESGEDAISILRKNLNKEEEFLALTKLMEDCKNSLSQKDIDFSEFSSKEIAADFEDLRKELGYNTWNLFGGSYGSRLGLTLMRDYPNSVKSALLFSVFAPENNLLTDFSKSFEDSLFSALKRCEKDEACNTRYPNLKMRMLTVLRNLENEPLTIVFEEEKFILNARDAILIIKQMLYHRSPIAKIPKFIEALEDKNSEAIIAKLNDFIPIYRTINLPMSYSVIVYEELPFTDINEVDTFFKTESKLGNEYYPYDLNSLKKWHPFRAPKSENQPVISSIPTLMVSGDLDPITPVHYATEALKNLENSFGVNFPDDSHALFNTCFFQMVEDFYNDPTQKPNSECTSIRKPIDWDLSPSL
jgi:pimeloyl-ACP methyl ester carboxylesterase